MPTVKALETQRRNDTLQQARMKARELELSRQIERLHQSLDQLRREQRLDQLRRSMENSNG